MGLPWLVDLADGVGFLDRYRRAGDSRQHYRAWCAAGTVARGASAEFVAAGRRRRASEWPGDLDADHFIFARRVARGLEWLSRDSIDRRGPGLSVGLVPGI